MPVDSSLFLVIMAGGSGTRFWPKSTARRPKQLLGFGREHPDTLIVQTLKRFNDVVEPSRDRRFIVTTELLKSAIENQVGTANVTTLAEPAARNTAPCVYWAAREVYARDPKGILLVMPSDHYIPQQSAFRATVRAAAEWARTHDDLVTLGVKPDRPETGYGYLKTGSEVGSSSANGAAAEKCRRVDAFVEKPNLERAKEFVSSGNYLWNGGMFLWRAEIILRAFDEFMPELKVAWENAQGKVADAYPKMTATSIDYGVMEKAKNVVTFTLDAGWDDLGSWTSLETLADVLRARHEAGVVTGGDVLCVESTGNIVDAPGKLVTLLGVKDLIVVHQGDSILVARKERAQDIKLIVDQVKARFPDKA
jgi:mannose-1-phosphate guanylyltransferase